MLGQAVCGRLEGAEFTQVFRTQRADAGRSDYLDAECTAAESQLEDLLSHAWPDYIINCAGVLKHDIDREGDPAVLRAIRVNAVFPHLVAACAVRHSARVIHMSTDGVFSGTAARPYLESDAADAVDAYGKTKALGEAASESVLNVRCSIIGRDPVRGRGLLEWFLRAPDDSELTGYADQRWNGVTTDQFASFCLEALRTNCFDDIRRSSPVMHFCPNRTITKYELLNIWREVSGKRVRVRPTESGWGGRLLASKQESWRLAYPHSPSWQQLLTDVSTPSVFTPSQL
jgi:dTDP-4-dehydrorhamnose reductase